MNDISKWPGLTQQPIEIIDGTPDNEYPIRILRAYRKNCDCKWATESDGECNNPLFALMNEHAQQRAALLDKAISILKHSLK